nr:Gag-Pol polyprotein [Tanacetum cinerariifolium]
EVRLKSHDDMKIVGPSVFASMYRTMTSTSTKNRPHSKVAIYEYAYCKQKDCRCVWLPDYTFALQFADVFGSSSAL